MTIYHEGSRSYQDRFDTRRLADRIEERFFPRPRIDDSDRAFIEGCDMLFLATADSEGRPQCSYKGGEPGFVRVLDDRTIAFPNCPRYIHHYQLLERSRFVPKSECKTPVPAWKTREWAHDVLRADDPAHAPDADVVDR